MANTVDKLLTLSANDVGYLEKATNAHLDEKTANAGANNFTKFARDYGTYTGKDFQGQSWCAMAVSCWFVQTYGIEKAIEMLGGALFSYTPTGAARFKAQKRFYTANPQVGDVIFFKNALRIHHTGVVIKVTDSKVYTREGNTSGGTAVIANGGEVADKSYALTNSAIAGYGRPIYDVEVVTPAPAQTETAATTSVISNVVTASSLNIRAKASATAAKVGSYTKGTVIKITATSVGFAKTDLGWVSLDYVSTKTGTSTTTLNIRSEAGVSNTVVGSMAPGKTARLLAEQDGWYLTDLGGWVSAKYITLK